MCYLEVTFLPAVGYFRVAGSDARLRDARPNLVQRGHFEVSDHTVSLFCAGTECVMIMEPLDRLGPDRREYRYWHLEP